MMKSLLPLFVVLSAAVADAQSLLGESGVSPYDPPKPREWKRHDRLQLRFGGTSAAPAPAPAEAFTMAAEVADVRPNGVLVIQALRRRGAEGFLETLRITGELAPEAVVDGEAAGRRIANLCVTLEGGAPSRVPAWLSRLFESVAPY